MSTKDGDNDRCVEPLRSLTARKSKNKCMHKYVKLLSKYMTTGLILVWALE